MRISTAGMHQNALTAMLQQQSSLSKIQNQIATGRRVQTPADDPVAAVHILELSRALQESEQFKANSNMATNRLTLEEQAMADVTSLLHKVRELSIQANSATIDDASRRLIATEVRGRLGELADIANRRDANGEYLFAGFSTQTQPFNVAGGAVSYAGDQGNRLLQVGPSQRVADSHSGFDAFMNISEGNGTFVVDASSNNDGTGSITSGSVSDLSAWQPGDDYTLRFLTPSTWEVVDSANVQVTTGTFTGETDTISFRGISVGITGQPAATDEFQISRSRTEDLFTTLNDLITTLEQPGGTATARAQLSTSFGATLQQLDKSLDHVLAVRAEVGTRLSSLESASNAREDQVVELERMRSDLRDLDYAEAVTQMNQQLMALQAAQMSYSRISQLSLFDYLR
jgi:flagellar hook-associated protein 3 FlgL